MQTQNSGRRLEPEPQMQLWWNYGEKKHFLDANSAQCQLLRWEEASAHYKELRRGIVPFQYGEEEYVEEEK